VQGIFYGIKPAVVAVVVFAAWRIGSRAMKNGVLWAWRRLAFVGIFFFKIPSPGSCWRRHPRRHRRQADAGQVHRRRRPRRGNKQYGPALIDDDTPPPPHAAFPGASSASPLALFLRALGGGHAGAARQGGRPDAHGRFFTKAAFLTIGGAYAVLPYVYQGGSSTTAGSPARR
jgi:chromate transporter